MSESAQIEQMFEIKETQLLREEEKLINFSIHFYSLALLGY